MESMKDSSHCKLCKLKLKNCIMKLSRLFMIIISLIAAISCSNENMPESNIQMNSNDSLLQEVADFTEYVVDGAVKIYNSSNGDIDLQVLNDYIASFKFSTNVKSNSVYGFEDVDYIELLKDVLSPEAYEYMLHYLGKEELSIEDLNIMKIGFSDFCSSDQEFFDLFYSSTNIFYADLMAIDVPETRAVRNARACNILTSLLGAATGSIWAAAFGGPVGIVISAA